MEKMLRRGKEVVVIGETKEGRAIVRYVEDQEGMHSTRCYMCAKSELKPVKNKNKKLKKIYLLSIIDCSKNSVVYPNSEVIEQIECSTYPNDNFIKKHLEDIEINNAIASVKKVYKLV